MQTTQTRTNLSIAGQTVRCSECCGIIKPGSTRSFNFITGKSMHKECA